jgi:hypothetical protein
MSGTSNYSPYEPNAKGFTEALIDLKDTEDEARVVGFAQTNKNAGGTVRCLVFGSLATSGLDAGELYFLSVGYGAITATPPSSSGQYITRVGEAISGASLHVSLEPPIKVS